MKIKHINNSFFHLKTKDTSIVLDPWLGEMENTSTWSFPNMNNDKNILNKIAPNIIYISHLHTDHFDRKILSKYKNKKVKILIKEFSDKRLKNKLIELGYTNIIEIKSWKTYSNTTHEFTIIPCDQSNSAGISSEVHYDLDTSILIYDKTKKICFYNNVDNPLSIKSLKKLRLLVKKKYNKIDIASVGPRSASEFPQCFINIDKVKEKKKIIKKCFERSFEILKVLNVKKLIPAGGSYCITGKFHKLQKYVAHPDEKEINKYFSKKKVTVFNIDNGGELEISKNNITIFKPKKVTNKIKHNLTKRKFDYEKIKNNFDINKTFKKALKRYENIIKKIKIKTKYRINIYTYKNLEINSLGNINKNTEKPKKFSIFKGDNKSYLLECHLDEKLFYACMTDKYNWNMAMGGSSMLFNRKPNRFIPDVNFSLNFLKV